VLRCFVPASVTAAFSSMTQARISSDLAGPCLPQRAGLVSVKHEWEFANECLWCVDLCGMDHNAIGLVSGCLPSHHRTPRFSATTPCASTADASPHTSR